MFFSCVFFPHLIFVTLLTFSGVYVGGNPDQPGGDQVEPQSLPGKENQEPNDVPAGSDQQSLGASASGYHTVTRKLHKQQPCGQ